MNSTEVTMDTQQRESRFTALDVAIRAAAVTLRVVAKVPPSLRTIGDQATRAAASVPANLAEGQGRSGRDQLKHFRIAYAEAREVDVHLRLLRGAGAVNAESADQAITLFDRVRAMTWKLINR